MDKILKRAILILLACFLLSACTENTPAYLPPTGKITEDQPLTYESELKNDSGETVAVYSAIVPQFKSASEDSVAVQRINAYYSSVYSVFSQDETSFFDHVRIMLGDKLGSVSSAEPIYSFESSYSVLPGNSTYLSVQRNTIVYEDGTQLIFPSAQIFLADTGWKLGFSELFGDKTEDALGVLKQELTKWCESNSLPSGSVDLITAEGLLDRVAITGDNMKVLFPPFSLSTNDSDSYEALISLDSFNNLINK